MLPDLDSSRVSSTELFPISHLYSKIDGLETANVRGWMRIRKEGTYRYLQIYDLQK